MENLRREREEFQALELMNKCKDMGSIFNLMFFIRIAGLVITVASMAVGLFDAVKAVQSAASQSEIEVAARSISSAILICNALQLIASIVYMIFCFKLGNYQSEFRTAAIYYLIYQTVSIFGNTWNNNIIKLIAVVFTVLFILKFTYAMSEVFHPVDIMMSNTWDRFRTLYTYLMIATGVCYAVALIPIIGLIALLGIFACLIGMVVFEIWELILLYKSGVIMKNYMPPQPRNEDVVNYSPYSPEPEIAPENFDLPDDGEPVRNPFVPLGGNNN